MGPKGTTPGRVISALAFICLAFLRGGKTCGAQKTWLLTGEGNVNGRQLR